MHEVVGSKRRRVYSYPNIIITHATFYRKYINHLLPALFKLSSCNNGKNTVQIEKVVRFEVDMALALSSNDFKWSRALKLKLEEGADTKFHSCFNVKLDMHYSIPRPLIVVNVKEAKSARDTPKVEASRKELEEEELDRRIRGLRRILPGGMEMADVSELFSEAESYVVCLQLQVQILRCLVGSPHEY